MDKWLREIELAFCYKHSEFDADCPTCGWARQENNEAIIKKYNESVVGNIPQGGMGYYGAKPNKENRKEKKMAIAPQNHFDNFTQRYLDDLIERSRVHEQMEQIQAAQFQVPAVAVNASQVSVANCVTGIATTGWRKFDEICGTATVGFESVKQSSNKLLLLIKE